MLCVCCFCTLSANVMSQERLSMKLGEVPVKQVFEEIRRQTERIVICNDDRLDQSRRVVANFDGAELREILADVLRGSGMTFRFVDDYILIVPEQVQAADTVAKPLTLRGRVTDEKKQPLPGVSVVLSGTTVGVSTDAEGRFQLMLPVEKGTLEFSFVGYEKQSVAFDRKRDSLSVVLKPEAQALSDVVVTGYGNVSRGNYTGAATTIQAKDILMAGVSSIDQMLQGVVPGMLVMNKTGLVGASPKIRVRGTSTLLGSQEPVWVVDGVIQHDPQPFNSDENTKFTMDADDIKELAGNAISWLNPNDIESITVLKDASATAIYGSQAANGVIVITTKKAQAGRVQVSYSGDFSIGQRPRYGLYDLMNSADRMRLSRQIYEEKKRVSGTILTMGFESLLERYRNKEATIAELREEYDKMARQNTDWFDILFRNSFNHSHNLSISGGSEKLQNRTSFSYTEQNGEARGNKETQFTASSNTTVSLWDKVTLNFLLNGSIRNVEGFAYGVDPFNYAYETSRVIPCYNEDGSLYYHEKQSSTHPTFGTSVYKYNILNEEANTGSENRTRTWSATIDLKWKIFPWLEYQGLFAYSSSSSDTKQWASERSFYITQTRGYEYGAYLPTDEETGMTPLPQGGVLQTDLTNTTTVTVRNSLVYDKLFKEKHRVTLQLGIETNSTQTKGESNMRYGYMPDRGETFTTPPATYMTDYGYERDNITMVSGTHTVLNRTENKLSEYGMAVYTYDDRYVLNASARVDASNRFGQDKNKRFQPTWSVGLKWRLGNEPFARGRWWFNNLDIYGSYGYQGNAVSTVSPELITSYSTAYMDVNAQRIVSYPYPDLGWEKTKTWNIGVEGSFLEGRLNFTFNYFRKESYVLSSRAIPKENGVMNGIVGGTTMTNDGYDLVVNVVPVRVGDFSWQLSVNTSVTNNAVETESYSNTMDSYTSGTSALEGLPFSSFYSYIFTGLDEEYGQPMFKNMTQYGNGSNFESETVENLTDIMEVSGKFTPDFTGGLNTMFKYKNVSLYALFAVQWGGAGRLPELYDPYNWAGGVPKEEQNVSRKLNDRWRQPGDDTMIPSLPGTNDYVNVPEIINPSIGGRSQNRYYLYNLSSARVANTDFIRCRQLSLSYDFQGKWMRKAGLSYLQVKASMTNPFMWVSDKKWDGLDPETQDWPARRVSSLSLQVIF